MVSMLGSALAGYGAIAAHGLGAANHLLRWVAVQIEPRPSARETRMAEAHKLRRRLGIRPAPAGHHEARRRATASPVA